MEYQSLNQSHMDNSETHINMNHPNEKESTAKKALFHDDETPPNASDHNAAFTSDNLQVMTPTPTNNGKNMDTFGRGAATSVN